MRVGIVGGGCVGLVAAADLAMRGATVTLYERGELGSGSTGRAAGICYDAFADPIDAAVADRALERYREWELLDPSPYVWFAREQTDATAIREQVAEMQALGRDVAEITPKELAERYPLLSTDGIAAAGIARSAGVLDPDAVVDRLAQRARDAGVIIRTETPASLTESSAVETARGTESFDAVVVAAGPETKPLVADVGVPLALKTYRAQLLRTNSFEGSLPSVYDATTEFYWRPSGERLLVGDGTSEVDPDGWRRDADPSFVESTLDRVCAATTLEPRSERAWAGLCTATPDRDPLVGAVGDGLWVATGWQGHGLMRAPALGEYLAERLRGTTPTIDAPLAEQFDPTRFDGDESFHPLGDPTADW